MNIKRSITALILALFMLIGMISIPSEADAYDDTYDMTLASDGKAAPSTSTELLDGFLSSEHEIRFTLRGDVAKKAERLTKGKTTSEKKAMAIYSYLVCNFDYDWALHDDIVSGRVTVYDPDPEAILESGVGICYDMASLYAAMCRSVGIPCKLVKGDSEVTGSYHAWNEVYDAESDTWRIVDVCTDMILTGRARTSWPRLYGAYYPSTKT